MSVFFRILYAKPFTQGGHIVKITVPNINTID
jgi:hypothetical protein